jgi:hypothetical protein
MSGFREPISLLDLGEWAANSCKERTCGVTGLDRGETVLISVMLLSCDGIEPPPKKSQIRG